MALSPTLWRTARVLAGAVRLDLLKLIVDRPGLTVSELAESRRLSLPRASQELRRLQARGLVQGVRQGRHLRYRPAPDPLVASARPLLLAAKAALARRPEEETIRVARAFSHERRLSILRELKKAPRCSGALAKAAGIPPIALQRHLRVLRAGRLIRRTPAGWELTPGRHPLARAFLELLAG